MSGPPTAAPGLVIGAISPDDDPEAVRACFDIRCAAKAADRPGDPRLSWFLHESIARHPWPGSESEPLLARIDGQPVAWARLTFPTKENLDTANVDLEVHPSQRGRGVGQSLLTEATRRAAARDRHRLVAEAVIDSPGATFAAAAGFRPALLDTQRRLDVAETDVPHLDSIYADALAHSAGYSILSWAGATPAAHQDAVAALESRMTTDAPMDDLAWEQEVYDVERLQARDAMMSARRNRSYTTAARHDGTDRVVGTTSLIVVDGVDDAADQWQTIVEPEHRGHRLGLLIKIANLRFLLRHEPAVRVVDTWNADSNAPMLAVNVALGFRPVRRWAEWERRL